MNYLYEGKWEDLILEPSGDTLPIGAQIAFGGTTIPTNWLECNGQAVSRETYKDLFSVIGTYYGKGDESTTFNLPDKRSRKSVGRDTSDTDFDTVGKTGGEKEHRLTIDEMPAHKHELTIEGGGSLGASGVKWLSGTNMRKYAGDMIENAGGSQAHNNEDPYEVDCWIIKCANSIGLVGEVTSDINDTNRASAPNAKAVKDYVDKLNEKAIVNLVLSSAVLPTVKTYTPITNLKVNNGAYYTNKFIINNNNVKIGKGVSKILIKKILSSTIQNSNKDTIYSYDRKNGKNINYSWKYMDYTGSTLLISEIMIDVAENDVIDFTTYGAQSYKLNDNAVSIIIEQII